MADGLLVRFGHLQRMVSKDNVSQMLHSTTLSVLAKSFLAGAFTSFNYVWLLWTHPGRVQSKRIKIFIVWIAYAANVLLGDYTEKIFPSLSQAES